MAYSHEYYVSHKEKYLEAAKRYIAKKRAEKNVSRMHRYKNGFW